MSEHDESEQSDGSEIDLEEVISKYVKKAIPAPKPKNTGKGCGDLVKRRETALKNLAIGRAKRADRIAAEKKEKEDAAKKKEEEERERVIRKKVKKDLKHKSVKDPLQKKVEELEGVIHAMEQKRRMKKAVRKQAEKHAEKHAEKKSERTMPMAIRFPMDELERKLAK